MAPETSWFWRAPGAPSHGHFVPRSRVHDLVDLAVVRRAYRGAGPDIVIHLAPVVGGFGANQRDPTSSRNKRTVTWRVEHGGGRL